MIFLRFVVRFFAAIREILTKTAKAKFNVSKASKFSAANQQICHQPKLAEFKTRKFERKTSLVRLLAPPELFYLCGVLVRELKAENIDIFKQSLLAIGVYYRANPVLYEPAQDDL